MHELFAAGLQDAIHDRQYVNTFNQYQQNIYMDGFSLVHQSNITLRPHGWEYLNIRRNRVIDRLHRGKMCMKCSVRFTDDHNYRLHLDEHFKIDGQPILAHWYINPPLQPPTLAPNDLVAPANMSPSSDQGFLLNVVDDESTDCASCGDRVEYRYNPSEERFCFDDALRIDSRVYHQVCGTRMSNSRRE